MFKLLRYTWTIEILLYRNMVMHCNRLISNNTVEPVYFGHTGTCILWDQQKSPDYQGVLIFQVILCKKVPFGT